MGGNRKNHFQTITISPRNSPLYTVLTLDDFAKKLVLKYAKIIENYAYCIETGVDQSHPHIHFLIQYTTSRRSDKVREQITKYTVKALEHPLSLNLVVVKWAYNASTYLTRYMSKENLILVNDNFDLNLLVQRDDNVKAMLELRSETDRNGTKITRHQFPRIYRELLQKGDISPLNSDADMETYYEEVVTAAEKAGYCMSFFYMYKRFVWNVMEHCSKQPISLSFNSEAGVTIS